ncbi:MAG: methyltransferase domain-containing protein [Oceanospirillaceae bacterium]|nr:methyltransferase domain-containing protein [Oceanospirillaceae bacterium]
MTNPILACPLCKAPLAPINNSLVCEAKHCFDRAKQGYWNLLSVQQKKSLDPGDNPLMVQARSAFLDLDHYQPLAAAIQHILADELQQINSAQILDMGCGEGYYTSQWQQNLPQHQFLGLDISKHAVKAATRRNRDISWLVASGANMPIADHSLDVLSVLFSRLMPEPFARALKDDALLILVWPSANHLVQLKQALYQDVKTSSYDPIAELNPLFSLQSEQQLNFDFILEQADHLQTLLLMTPHGQRINDDTKASLIQQLPITLSFSVNIGCFRKRAQPV